MTKLLARVRAAFFSLRQSHSLRFSRITQSALIRRIHTKLVMARHTCSLVTSDFFMGWRLCISPRITRAKARLKSSFATLLRKAKDF